MAQIANCKPNTAPLLTVHTRFQPRSACHSRRVVCAARKPQHDAGSHTFPVHEQNDCLTRNHFFVDAATSCYKRPFVVDCRARHVAETEVRLDDYRVVSAVAPVIPATVLSLIAALPANAVGSGAELARPSTTASVEAAVKSAPSVLQSSSVDQAVNSVVDVVKVI